MTDFSSETDCRYKWLSGYDIRVLNYVVIPLEVWMRPLLRARRLYLSISCLPRLKNKTILFRSVNVSRN